MRPFGRVILLSKFVSLNLVGQVLQKKGSQEAGPGRLVGFLSYENAGRISHVGLCSDVGFLSYENLGVAKFGSRLRTG